MRRIWVGDSTLTASRSEKKPREGEGALVVFLRGGPEEMKGETQ